MGRTTRRTAIISCAAIVTGSVALLPVQAAYGGVAVTPKSAAAAGGYYGVWILKSWDIGGRVLPCPVNVPLPPGAPSVSCGTGSFLKLFRNGRYDTDLPVFRTAGAHRGAFAVVDLHGPYGNVVVFDDDGARETPRAYRLSIPRSGVKAPKTMTISTSMSTGVPGGSRTVFKMNFGRYSPEVRRIVAG